MRQCLLLFVLLFGGQVSAETVVLDFQDLYDDVSYFQPVGNPDPTFTQGFEITSNELPVWVKDQYSPGTAMIGLGPDSVHNLTAQFTLTAQNGQAFSIHSFDTASRSTSLDYSVVTAEGDSGVLSFNGLNTDTSTLQTFDTTGLLDNIFSITFMDTGLPMLIDNINISVVPIPAAVWLFGSAIAVLGFIRRKSMI
ncbi:MAG: VPLPA-CTERM sorting domain-containing protein [Gammaproteobacteria bacterium]